MEFYRLLKSSENSAIRDCSIFNSWEQERISTLRAIELFKLSNKIDPEVNIGVGEFVKWLNSLGYFRGEANG